MGFCDVDGGSGGDGFVDDGKVVPAGTKPFEMLLFNAMVAQLFTLAPPKS